MLSFPMTRQLISALIVVFVSVMGAQAQSGDVAKVLMELENAWVDALVKADTAKLDAILVDTYVDTEEGGHQSDKQGTLAVLKSGDLKFKSIKLSNMKVYAYGNAAVITGVAAQMGLLGATPLSPNLCSPTPLSCKTGRGRRPRHIGLPRQNEIAGRSIRPQAASDRGTFHADLMKFGPRGDKRSC